MEGPETPAPSSVSTCLMPTTDHPPAETGTPPPSRRGRRLPVGPVGLLLTTLVAVLAALGFIRFVAGQDDEEPVRVQDALDQLDAGPVVPDGAEVAEVGQPAPNVRLDYLDGGSQTLDELRGTPVVINFWSSTCAPCLQEMPALQEVSSDTAGKVTFVGVDVADTAEAGSTMVEKTGVTYRNARDPRSEIFGVFGGTALPRTVLLDEDGVVVDTHSGQLTAPELTDLLQRNDLLP